MLSHLRKVLRRKSDPVQLLARLAPAGLALERLVHVGAHLGQERHRYEALGYIKVLWIEGSQSVHDRLVKSLAEHTAERIATGQPEVEHISVCALLTDRDGDTAVLREFSNDGMSSSLFAATDTLKARWPDLHETGQHQTTLSRTLDGLLNDLQFGNVDTLVVDVQGAELLVLRGSLRTLSNVKAVISEVSTQPLYAGGVLFPELAAFLQAQGFLPMSVPRRHGDMLFVHPERTGIHP
jgi:FkbM family methyltransferase